jgi:hypothetical protein
MCRQSRNWGTKRYDLIYDGPGKGWNVLFRLYAPLEPWFDKTWRLGEFEVVK